MRHSANVSLFFPQRKHLASALVCIWVDRWGSNREKTLIVVYYILQPQCPPLLWAVTSAFPSVLRQWHSSFVLESPHLIHGRLTPQSEAAPLIRWFLRHWITWPFVCSVSWWRGASALCELLTCKTCLKDTEWLMHWEDDCQQGHGERSVTLQRNKPWKVGKCYMSGVKWVPATARRACQYEPIRAYRKTQTIINHYTAAPATSCRELESLGIYGEV